MNIEVTLAGHAERLIVRNLMELYQHDFSELDGTDLDEHGQYGYPDLDCFWNHAGHAAHVIKVDGKWAGFALTNQEVYLPGSTHAIVEFFVVRKYRRLGVGQHAAQAIIRQLPARWEMHVIAENEAARRFWQKLACAHWPDKQRMDVFDNEQWRGLVFSVDTLTSP